MITLVSRVVMPLILAAVFLLVVLAGAVGDATRAPVPLERVAANKAPKPPKPPRKPHVVLLILDELPSDSLLDRRGRIDPAPDPDFAPPAVGGGGRAGFPRIPPLLNRGRPERFNRWVRKIRDGRPTFWMKHLLLPHMPYMYLPSGARTRPGPRDPLPGMTTVPGFHDEYLTRHNEQRYLLQLGYTDRLLGRLLRRLEREDIYDETLVVVVADHGYLWRSGVQTRRRALAPAPLRRGRPRPALHRDRPESRADRAQRGGRGARRQPLGEGRRRAS